MGLPYPMDGRTWCMQFRHNRLNMLLLDFCHLKHFWDNIRNYVLAPTKVAVGPDVNTELIILRISGLPSSLCELNVFVLNNLSG